MYRGRLWTFRQYAGFGDARETNRRFRYLLEQGQTGLSVAFDLPTQIGYDSDHPLALGEVGRVGVAISSIEDMERLLEGIPLDGVSISMTINATAPILLAFLVAVARRRGVAAAKLQGTVQNDILKEFISRRTYRFPAGPSLRLVTDVFDYCRRELPRWNPISISGYHMREAGSTAVQEVGFTLANAIAYLDTARARGLALDDLTRRVSFFWNAHNHLLEEVAKFRAARRLWARLVRERFGLTDPACARMRFHVQTAGSTLTSREPENNIVRVTVQALAAILGGAQSLHTNSMDEALGLPGKTAARVALRTQEILAFESGVADVADPLGGAPAIEALTRAVEDGARRLIDDVDGRGGALRAVEDGYQEALIEEEAYRHQQAVDSGLRPVVGVNLFRDEESEATGAAPERIDPGLEKARREELGERRAARDPLLVGRLRAELRRTASAGENVVDPLVLCADGGVTLGEMVATLAEVFGEHAE
jgi:methylmalonyl-CoA mutase N-terminal domain/subunit